MGKVANAGSSRYAVPDQYKVQDWYVYSNGGWDAVYRSDNSELAQLSANMGISAANNDNIRYIYGGTSYHTQLKKCNDKPETISTSCGTDCMGSCFANIKGAMRRLDISGSSKLPDLGSSQANSLTQVGYKKLSGSQYLTSDKYAERGDVYVRYGHHACMYVGDGELHDYDASLSSSSSSSSSSAVSLNYEAMSPYVLKIPTSKTSFDAKKFLDSQVSGVLLSAGSLYTSSHNEKSEYMTKNLTSQVKCAEEGGLAFALLAEVRAKSVGEAKKECARLYYVCAKHIPNMGLWLHLDFNNSKKVNNNILNYYVEECSSWGFKNSLGIYVTEDEKKNITWDDYSEEDLYLWTVDHSVNIDGYIGVLPFSS